MRHRAAVASRPAPQKERRGGPPLALAGVAALVALAIAYLGDCLPGFGTGGAGSSPSSSTPAANEPAPEAAEPAGARVVITVQGDRCRLGAAEPVACPELCATLEPKAQAEAPPAKAERVVEIDASAGSHGAVEDLRACLTKAGFTAVHIRSE